MWGIFTLRAVTQCVVGPGGTPYIGAMEQPIWNDFAALALTVALVLLVCL